MSVSTEELERLVATATEPGCEGHDSWIICPPCDALRSLERLAPDLAAEVLAGRKKIAAADKALEAWEAVYENNDYGDDDWLVAVQRSRTALAELRKEATK